MPRKPHGLALTPPMVWNNWNTYRCDITKATVHQQADAMVSSGMKAAGYRYVVVDDCWQGHRDAAGNIEADPVRFPSGIKALAEYVHAQGLKFGIYSDAGDKTCDNKPGSRGHEFQDAQQYAAWGVDYLKYDWCNSESLEVRAAYSTMSDALRATGRPILYSICEWGTPATTAEVGQFYSFTPTVVASAGSSLTYAVANKPAWAQFSVATGTLSGTPSTGSAATGINNRNEIVGIGDPPGEEDSGFLLLPE